MNIAVIFFIFFVWIAIVVGICALFVWICKKIAESKGLPSSYMWFGLLGVIGIIIVAVMGHILSIHNIRHKMGKIHISKIHISEIIHTNSLSNKAVAHTVELLLITILLLAVIVDKC